jgi:hypothetical protein
VCLDKDNKYKEISETELREIINRNKNVENKAKIIDINNGLATIHNINSIDDYNNQIEKLNNNNNQMNVLINNEPEFSFTAKNRQFNRGNSNRKETRNYFGSQNSRKQSNYDRSHDKKETHQHLNIHQYFNTNNYQRKMPTMPKTSGLHDRKSRKGKIMLDSFSKPLIY